VEGEEGTDNQSSSKWDRPSPVENDHTDSLQGERGPKGPLRGKGKRKTTGDSKIQSREVGRKTKRHSKKKAERIKRLKKEKRRIKGRTVKTSRGGVQGCRSLGK